MTRLTFVVFIVNASFAMFNAGFLGWLLAARARERRAVAAIGQPSLTHFVCCLCNGRKAFAEQAPSSVGDGRLLCNDCEDQPLAGGGA